MNQKFYKVIYGFSAIFFLVPLSLAEAGSIPSNLFNTDNGRIKVVIDSDAANEIDDLFAITRALIEPKFQVVGIGAAHFGSDRNTRQLEASMRDIRTILDLMDMEYIPLKMGANEMKRPGQIRDSDAARQIIEIAHAMPRGEKLNVFQFGPATNMAAATLIDPTIIPKVRLWIIGMKYDVRNETYTNNFNTGNDEIAQDTVLNTEDLEIIFVPSNIGGQLRLWKKRAVNHFQGSPIARWLWDRWNGVDHDPWGLHWPMIDNGITEAIINPHLATHAELTLPEENNFRKVPGFIDFQEVEIERFYYSRLDRYHSGEVVDHRWDSDQSVDIDPEDQDPSLEDGERRACHAFNRRNSSLGDFGLPFNVFSSERELLIKPFCQGDDVELEVGNARSTTIIFDQAYRWNGEWSGLDVNCSGEKEGNWCIASATSEMRLSPGDNFLVYFICHWDGNDWNCGCRDQACEESSWQLQGITKE